MPVVFRFCSRTVRLKSGMRGERDRSARRRRQLVGNVSLAREAVDARHRNGQCVLPTERTIEPCLDQRGGEIALGTTANAVPIEGAASTTRDVVAGLHANTAMAPMPISTGAIVSN
jgi:hypothetical protein